MNKQLPSINEIAAMVIQANIKARAAYKNQIKAEMQAKRSHVKPSTTPSLSSFGEDWLTYVGVPTPQFVQQNSEGSVNKHTPQPPMFTAVCNLKKQNPHSRLTVTIPQLSWSQPTTDVFVNDLYQYNLLGNDFEKAFWEHILPEISGFAPLAIPLTIAIGHENEAQLQQVMDFYLTRQNGELEVHLYGTNYQITGTSSQMKILKARKPQVTDPQWSFMKPAPGIADSYDRIKKPHALYRDHHEASFESQAPKIVLRVLLNYLEQGVSPTYVVANMYSMVVNSSYGKFLQNHQEGNIQLAINATVESILNRFTARELTNESINSLAVEILNICSKPHTTLEAAVEGLVNVRATSPHTHTPLSFTIPQLSLLKAYATNHQLA